MNKVPAHQLGEPVAFHAYRSSAYSVSGTNQKLNLQAELYDYGGNYDSSSDYEFTAPYDGIYHFDAGIRMTNFDASGDTLIAYIYVNGSVARGAQNANVIAGSGDLSTNLSTDLKLDAGDTVQLWCDHSSASTESIATGTTFTYLTGHLVGRLD